MSDEIYGESKVTITKGKAMIFNKYQNFYKLFFYNQKMASVGRSSKKRSNTVYEFTT